MNAEWRVPMCPMFWRFHCMAMGKCGFACWERQVLGVRPAVTSYHVSLSNDGDDKIYYCSCW